MTDASISILERIFRVFLAVAYVCVQSDLTRGHHPDLGTSDQMSCTTMRRSQPAVLKEGERLDLRVSTTVPTAIENMVGLYDRGKANHCWKNFADLVVS